ncbi:hypothetical protein VTO42DRAFT_4786 [Malbranchea cinnamomea]
MVLLVQTAQHRVNVPRNMVQGEEHPHNCVYVEDQVRHLHSKLSWFGCSVLPLAWCEAGFPPSALHESLECSPVLRNTLHKPCWDCSSAPVRQCHVVSLCLPLLNIGEVRSTASGCVEHGMKRRQQGPSPSTTNFHRCGRNGLNGNWSTISQRTQHFSGGGE